MFGFLKKKTTSDNHNFAPKTGASVDFSGFNKVINFCLYALVLLTPLLFSSWASEVRDFNKQAFVFLGVVVILGVWVVKILTSRSVSWVKTSLDYILLAYLGVYFLTSLTSIDKVSSFLGYYGRFTGSFLSVLTMVVLYFLVVNNLKSERIVKKITNYYLIGSAIVLVYSFLQLLGAYILPFAFTHDRGFNPIGSLVALAIYAAMSVVFLQWMFFVETNRTKARTFFLGFLTVLAFAILFLINSFVAWLVLALSLVAFLALSMTVMGEKQSSPTWFWKPMLALVVSVLFVAFQFLPAVVNPRNLVSVDLPVEIQLSNSTTWNLVGNSFKHGVKNALLGSGPGTTGIAFGDIKPTDLNKTIVWSLNFDRASSEVANIAIESGLLGLLAFELVSILFFFYGLFFLLKRSDHVGWKYAFGFFMLWLALYITHFFYFFNSSFYFIYWFAIAIFMAVAHMTAGESEEESRSLSFSSSPRSALSWMFVSLLLLAALLVGAFFEAAIYGAEASYTAGVKELNQAKPDFAKVANSFGRAITLNPYRDTYLLAYGQNLIFQASEEAAKEQPNVAQIQSWMSDLITAGQNATNLSPAKASNWSALAQFYTGIRPLVNGTDKYILESWQKAIDRDPKNPALYVQLAQAYSNASEVIDPAIVGSGADADQDGLSDAKEQELGSDSNNTDTNGNGVSDGDEVKNGYSPSGTGRLTAAQVASFTKIDQAMLKQAQDALNKAIELKPDLPDSYIALARVLEKANKIDEAKKQLDQAAKDFPGNADILFEQGRITYNQKNYNAAEKIFLQVVAIVPTHANAHYSLGLIYLQRNDKVKALAEFEKTREITGPNVDLEKQINELKAQ
jgi:tetratricopeptide (TPR) repeat protein